MAYQPPQGNRALSRNQALQLLFQDAIFFLRPPSFFLIKLTRPVVLFFALIRPDIFHVREHKAVSPETKLVETISDRIVNAIRHSVLNSVPP